MAFDRSVRFKDQDGHLHVEWTRISKATVNPYYGREIPGCEALGLDPARIYQLLRDPEELAKGAATFNNLRLLSKHVAVSASDPKEELVAGSTGTDARFEAPYLVNSLVIWRKEDIDAVESREKCELSCAYYYRPDMTPGIYSGLKYDGVMRDIRGNHVALVEAGRAGPDVMVHDSKESLMADETEEERKAREAKEAEDKAKDAKAKDEDMDDEEAMDEDQEEAEKEEKEAKDKKAKDKKMSRDKKAKDAAPEKEAMDKAAMDAAIGSAVTAAEQRIVERFRAATEAREIVRPLVGSVSMALDTAEAIFKVALDARKVDLTGVPTSAYRAIVKTLQPVGTKQPAMAHDGAGVATLATKFPTLARIGRA
ncbi:MAG: DUF2213 domain-containing protein [Rhodopila sp.]|nr:DUF2213 domain-containing protein [Rhodopila sp.]